MTIQYPLQSTSAVLLALSRMHIYASTPAIHDYSEYLKFLSPIVSALAAPLTFVHEGVLLLNQ